MDFFEVLLILAFIGLPLIEGILKRSRKGRGTDDDGQLGQLPGRTEAPWERVPPPAPPSTTTTASRPGGSSRAEEMIPADLWEILTGERRPAPVAGNEWESGDGAWEEDWSEEEGVEEERAEKVAGPKALDSYRREKVSLEYVGPEAVSLEVPLPSPEVRHREFHEKYDAPVVERTSTPDRVERLRRELRGQGLRKAVLLTEILGPPKGLEPL